jgi:hypothetical protein
MIGFIADMIEHPMKRWKQMIEMRVVDNGLMCRPDFQYRHRILKDIISVELLTI